MANIFISYSSRADTDDWVKELHARLAQHYGSSEIFTDRTILPGDHFDDTIFRKLEGSDVVLAVIGRSGVISEYARAEIEFALQNGKSVLPILVDGAQMPSPRMLPQSIANISDISGIDITGRTEAKFTELFAAIDRLAEAKARIVARRASDAASIPQRKFFISYRRSDSAIAGRLFDRIEGRFGNGSAYIDVNRIPFGADFRDHIGQAMRQSAALIALIGPNWVGRRWWRLRHRIFDIDDPVQVELQTAFDLDIRIFPATIDDSRVPGPRDVPEQLSRFVYLNALPLASGRDFDRDTTRLLDTIDGVGKAS